MGDSHGIETLGRLVQICALCDQELKVVKARDELVEGVLETPEHSTRQISSPVYGSTRQASR